MQTIQEFDEAVKRLSELEKEYGGKSEALKALGHEIDTLKREILQALSEQGLSAFKGSTASVSIASRYNVKFPRGDGKDELKKYMQERGVFDGMWSINHQTLNAWYKAELEAAQLKGEYLDVPGLEPVEDKYLTMRKTNK